jgi:glycosyltransferase involved in cell wall biosynthesis
VTPDGGGPLSLLFVIPSLPPMGGAEVHAARLAAALRRRGHGLTLLTMAGEFEAGLVPPFRPPEPPQRRRAYPLRIARKLLRSRGRYDAAHFFLAGRHASAGVLAAWLAGCPSVVMYGGTGTFPAQRASWRGRLALGIDVKLADRLIALNEEMRGSFRACGAPDRRIVILPCEVDPAIFRPGLPLGIEAARARFGIPSGARVVTFVGRFVPEKELPTLVAAFAQVSAADPAAFLVLAGDGPQRPAVNALIARLPEPGRVVAAGALAEADVRDLLQASDVFALASSLEGIPCALVEAMSVGLPCVVSDIAGTREAVSAGVNGLRVAVGNPQELAAALLALLSDPERRSAMGRESRRRVLERYSTDIVAAAHERLYREIVAEKAGRGRAGSKP